MANRQYIYIKTTAPTVNDDTLDGYLIDDRWVDTTNDRTYQAIDVTAGAAIWVYVQKHNHSDSSNGGAIMGNLYKLSVTVSSNDLVVALKHPDGTDPSSSNPLYFWINGTVRTVTAATSITIADGTNWFNSGAAELGTLAVPYFVYVVWDSNSSIVALSIARIPYGRLVSDFSATTTNEKHLYNYANFTSTDDVVNIGYFEATLSLSGTSHLWTVPTFTNANLRHEPTFTSQMMTWTPGHTGYSTPPTTNNNYTYRIRDREVALYYLDGTGSTSNLTTYTATAPFSPSVTAHGVLAQTVDAGTIATTPGRVFVSGSTMTFRKDMASTTTWTASGEKRAVIMPLILVL